MSFITRCPACATAFKVVPDQLKISDGWVRCGHCHQVFDATLDLQPWWPGQPVPGEETAVDAPPESPPDTQPESTPPPPSPSPVAESAALAAPRPEPEPEPEPEHEPPIRQDAEPPPAAPEPAGEPEPWHFESDPPPDFQPTSVIEPFLGPDPEREPEADVSQLDATDHLDPDAPEPDPAPAHAPSPAVAQSAAAAFAAREKELSFVRQAQRRAFWRRPAIRWLLGLIVLLLSALLAIQILLDRRDEVARDYPAARPALEALCAYLDCTIETPRQLDHVVIDSSVLLRRGPGRYSFNVVIRNRSDQAVAMPAIELTLTDIQDQVLVRRVLPPAEWPRTAEVLDAGAEWSLQFDLALEPASDQVMTGYRALLFYP